MKMMSGMTLKQEGAEEVEGEAKGMGKHG